ncbi:PREDICTED: cytochrome P450 3A9-like [Gekko japonicus]|uniref:Cytochrome P450 3A n=1 Tax=Gekko japonicus TaxID=146911 RepID=A0ABM1KMF1_GEKJA|nr:PREDICTED: cytochrome P450 3A9-like [Gekko japonicus]
MLYGVWPFRVFKRLGIPGPTPVPFFGTAFNYRHGFVQFDNMCHKKYGKIWGYYDGRQPVLAVMDPTIIKTVLVKECYANFTNRRNIDLVGMLDQAVSIAKDEQWKRIRTVLSPTFTSGKLKEMFPIIKNYGEVLVQNVQKKVERDEPIEVKEIFGAYSMDVVTSTSFGVNIDSLNNPKDPFVKEIRKMTKFNSSDPLIILSVMFPFLTPILRLMKVNLFPNDALDFFSRSVRKIREERQKEGKGDRVDFLQLMIDSQGENSNGANGHQQSNGVDHSFKGLTDAEVLAQAVIFIFAGYEPSSSSLGYIAYLLATHPDVQQKLHDEIESVLPNKVSPSTAQPKFSKENRESIDPYTYLPFGAGPRNCIGMRFALVTMKVAIVRLLQHFSFRTCKETPIPLGLDTQVFLMPKRPIVLKLVPREKEE